MTRKELYELYNKLGKAYDDFDRANANVQLRHGYHGQIIGAQKQLRQAEAEVERAEEELGETFCFNCDSWFPIEADHDCLNVHYQAA